MQSFGTMNGPEIAHECLKTLQLYLFIRMDIMNLIVLSTTSNPITFNKQIISF